MSRGPPNTEAPRWNEGDKRRGRRRVASTAGDLTKWRYRKKTKQKKHTGRKEEKKRKQGPAPSPPPSHHPPPTFPFSALPPKKNW